MIKILILLSGLLILVTQPALAIELLDITMTDKVNDVSDYFLNNSIIGAMSMVLNLGCLLFAGLIIGYTALSGVMNTAHEGNVMGKAYNSMWVPVRTTFAIALMLPMASGYSVMQLGVIEVMEMGAGLASKTWNTALDHMNHSGTLYSPPSVNQGQKLATSIFKSTSCMEAVRRETGIHLVIERVAKNSGNDDEYKTEIVYTGEGSTIANLAIGAYTAVLPDHDWGHVVMPVDVCGKVSLTFQKPDENDISSPIKAEFMGKIQDYLAELEESIYQLSHSILNENAAILTGLELEDAAKIYDDQVRSALIYAVGKLNDARVDDTTWTDQAKAKGFMAAGAFYGDIIRMHQETLDFAAISPTAEGPDTTYLNENLPSYNDIMKLSNTYLENRLTVDKYGDTVPVSSTNQDESILNGLSKSLQDSLREAITSQEDPTITMTNIGHGVINTLYAAGATALAAKVAAKGTESSLYLKLIPGGGAATGVLNAMASEIYELLKTVAGILLIPATALAFYLPMIPYILWMLGIAGWLVLFIEALIAAPIWAAAHSIPEGNGAINSHARVGYMIVLSLFLRPTLMLFGFFASFFVNIIVGKLILSTYLAAVLSASGENAIGLLSIIAYIIILGVIMIMLAHRSFGLIHEIPDKVLRYIGAGQEQLGEATNEHQGRTMIVGAISRVPSAGGKYGGGGKGGGGTGESPVKNSLAKTNQKQNELSPN